MASKPLTELSVRNMKPRAEIEPNATPVTRSAAQRMRAHRERRRLGLRVVAVQVFESELDALVAEQLTRKAIKLGKNGNLTALRLCLDRIVPPRRDRPLSFELPRLERAEDAAKAMGAIAAAIANGDLTISEAAEVSKIIETFVHALEAMELERRLRAVEEQKK
jgi:hypothetical protein